MSECTVWVLIHKWGWEPVSVVIVAAYCTQHCSAEACKMIFSELRFFVSFCTLFYSGCHRVDIRATSGRFMHPTDMKIQWIDHFGLERRAISRLFMFLINREGTKAPSDADVRRWSGRARRQSAILLWAEGCSLSIGLLEPAENWLALNPAQWI